MTRTDLLDEAQHAVNPDADPDGVDARGALLLAVDTAHAAAAGDPAEHDRWTFAAAALEEAVERLSEDLTTPYVLTAEPATANESRAADTRPAMLALVTSLADLYAHAAVDQAASPWRRTVWADVAQHLDRAAAELR